MNTSGIFSRNSKSKSERSLTQQADYIKKLKERYTIGGTKPASALSDLNNSLNR